MRTFIRAVAFPIACALTGAASALLVVALSAQPERDCPPESPPIQTFNLNVSAAPPAPLAPPAPPSVVVVEHHEPAPALPAEAVQCTEDNRCVVSRQLLNDLFSNPSVLATQARVMPSIKDGQTRGFKFYGIRPGSLPRLLGMKNGDLVTAIDGVPLLSVEQVMNTLVRLRKDNALDLDIERKDATFRLHIEIR